MRLWPFSAPKISALHAHGLKQAREVEARGCQVAAHDAPARRSERRLHRLLCVQVCAGRLRKDGALSVLQ